MRFTFSALLAVVLISPAVAQEDGLTGFWKFNLYEQGQPTTLWLLNIDKDKQNKVTVAIDPLKGAPKVKIEDVKQDGDTLKVKLVATIPTERGPQQVSFEYEGRLPKPGAKKIFGSLVMQGRVTMPVVLESTSAKTPFEVYREIVQKTPNDPKALTTIFDVLEKAKDNKVDAKDVQGWVDGSLKAAEMYGPRFLLTHHLELLGTLDGQKPYVSVAVETARRFSKTMDAKLPLDTQAKVVALAVKALRAGDAAPEAEKLEARLDEFEIKGYAHYHAQSAFKTEKFAGRKGKSSRAVLVELFTGAQCPPCVAADLAFDGLEKTYGPGEVVLLQYHMNVPGPEPMSNKDTDDRFDYYADAYPAKVRGTPTTLFNGKIEAPHGGSRDEAADKYKEYCDVVNMMLETANTVKVSATAVRTVNKIAITAKVSGLDKPGDKVRLRLALVEDWVRYKAGNGLQYHHRVVRAMPAGVKGVPVKEKDLEHQASVDLDALRTTLNKYLNDEYGDGPRPMRLRNLSVVAFVQDDASHEVLQAVNVPVK